MLGRNRQAFVPLRLLNLKPAPAGLSFAAPRASDHLVLRRVVTKDSFDSSAQTDYVVPGLAVHLIALVAQVGETGLQVPDLCLDSLRMI